MVPVAGVFMPWWGTRPGWESEFILRACALRSLEIILVGDAAAFEPAMALQRIHCTLDEFEARATETAGVPVHKATRGFSRGQCLCELRPMMADMYPEAIQRYPWWGWGEWDCVWGDWDSYLTEKRLERYDMISSSSHTVNGPMTLFRNTIEFRQLYRKRLDIVSEPSARFHLDERGMQGIVSEEAAAGRIRCLYPIDLDAHDRTERWSWCTVRGQKVHRMDEDGRVGGELLNFHFPGTGGWPVRTGCPIE
jgi:hypothetical protein